MATTSSIALTTRNSLLRPIALGGMIIGIVQLIIQQWLVYSVLGKTPFITVSQYIASGILGNAAFEGGIATALLGVLIPTMLQLIEVIIEHILAIGLPLGILVRRNAQ